MDLTKLVLLFPPLPPLPPHSMLELCLSFQGPQGSKSSHYSLHTISGSGRKFSLFFGPWVPFCCTQMCHFPFLIYFPQPLGSHPALIAKERFPWKQELVHYILYLTGPVPKWLLFIFIPLFLCSLLLKTKFIWKAQSGIGGTILPWEECERPRSSSLPLPFGIRRGAGLALSFSTNVLLGDFVLAPFFPRLTPWMVAVAVVLMVLGLLTIGSIFFTWRLYKERSRQRRHEFSSKGKS